MIDVDNALVSIETLQGMLSVSRRTLFNWLDADDIPRYEHGGAEKNLGPKRVAVRWGDLVEASKRSDRWRITPM